MKPGQAKYVEVRPYGWGLWLSTDHAGFRKACKKAGVSNEDIEATLERAPMGVCQSGTEGFAVGVFEGDPAQTLVHELIHVGCITLVTAGIDTSHANGEPLCYLVDDLFARCMRLLKEQK